MSTVGHGHTVLHWSGPGTWSLFGRGRSSSSPEEQPAKCGAYRIQRNTRAGRPVERPCSRLEHTPAQAAHLGSRQQGRGRLVQSDGLGLNTTHSGTGAVRCSNTRSLPPHLTQAHMSKANVRCSNPAPSRRGLHSCFGSFLAAVSGATPSPSSPDGGSSGGPRQRPSSAPPRQPSLSNGLPSFLCFEVPWPPQTTLHD